jgi:hypothetical protein
LADKEPVAWLFILGTYKKTRFLTNHSAVFNPAHQTTDFRQTTVLTTAGDPSQIARAKEGERKGAERAKEGERKRQRDRETERQRVVERERESWWRDEVDPKP